MTLPGVILGSRRLACYPYILQSLVVVAVAELLLHLQCAMCVS